jgi:hypothetical protein
LEQLVAQPGRLLAVSNVSLGLADSLKQGVSPSLNVTLSVEAFKLSTAPPAAATK